MKIRRMVYDIIQPDNGTSIASRTFDWIITSLVLASVVIVFSDTFDLPVETSHFLDGIEGVISIVFTIEYLLRIVTADYVFPWCGFLRSRIKYVFTPMAMIDLLSILPFWLPMMLPGSMLGLRAFRLVRLFRILKLNRYFDAMHSIVNVVESKKRELLCSLFFVVILMLVSSLMMYSAEHDAQPNTFRNAFSGLWWAVSTLTTVGYGDIYPITVFGKILGAVIAFSGIAALAIPTGIITSGLTEQLSHKRLERELAKQRQRGEIRDEELIRQREKDAEHDRILREHGELLKIISSQLTQLVNREEKSQRSGTAQGRPPSTQ